MINEIWSMGDDRFNGGRVRNICGKSAHGKRRSGRRVRGDCVGHCQVLHWFAANAQPFRNRVAEFATNHAGRSNHQNIHISSVNETMNDRPALHKKTIAEKLANEHRQFELEDTVLPCRSDDD
jgi:hypothetical protein